MTTDPHGWPDPARPGYPQHPERDGWHWVLLPSGETYALWWRTSAADVAVWAHGTRGVPAAAFAETGCTYLGPCLTPAEVAAQVEAAERRGMELAAIGIPAATLAGLRDGSLVAVPRDTIETLRDAGRALHNAAVAAVGALKASGYKRGTLAIACMSWRAAVKKTEPMEAPRDD